MKIKNKKEVLITGTVFLLSLSFAVWVQFNERAYTSLASSLLLLNTKYEVTAAEAFDEGATSPFISSSVFGTDLFAGGEEGILEDGNEIIIKIKSDGYQYKEGLTNVISLKMREDVDLEEAARNYREIPGIEFAEPNYKIEVNSIVDMVSHVSEVLEREVLSSGSVVVAIIDSGVDIDHPLLRGRVDPGWDFVSNTEIVTDNNGHGTHVAGVVLQNSEVARILPVKFLDLNQGNVFNLAQAIKYAADHRAKVINLSLGLQEESRLLEEAIGYAEAKGAVIVAAAGNNGSQEKYYPAAWDETAAVAALNTYGEKLTISNYGDWIDFSALGQNVYSASPNGTYSYRTGTSQATPVVSALIAELIQEMKNREGSVETQRIMDILTGQWEEGDPVLGKKILNVDKAKIGVMDNVGAEEEAEKLDESPRSRANSRVRFRSLW